MFTFSLKADIMAALMIELPDSTILQLYNHVCITYSKSSAQFTWAKNVAGSITEFSKRSALWAQAVDNYHNPKSIQAIYTGLAHPEWGVIYSATVDSITYAVVGGADGQITIIGVFDQGLISLSSIRPLTSGETISMTAFGVTHYSDGACPDTPDPTDEFDDPFGVD